MPSLIVRAKWRWGLFLVGSLVLSSCGAWSFQRGALEESDRTVLASSLLLTPEGSDLPEIDTDAVRRILRVNVRGAGGATLVPPGGSPSCEPLDSGALVLEGKPLFGDLAVLHLAERTDESRPASPLSIVVPPTPPAAPDASPPGPNERWAVTVAPIKGEGEIATRLVFDRDVEDAGALACGPAKPRDGSQLVLRDTTQTTLALAFDSQQAAPGIELWATPIDLSAFWAKGADVGPDAPREYSFHGGVLTSLRLTARGLLATVRVPVGSDFETNGLSSGRARRFWLTTVGMALTVWAAMVGCVKTLVDLRQRFKEANAEAKSDGAGA